VESILQSAVQHSAGIMAALTVIVRCSICCSINLLLTTEAHFLTDMQFFISNSTQQLNLSYQAEAAANKGNLIELFAITRALSRKQIQINRPIRNKDGTLLTNTEEQLKRWQEHF